MIGFRIFMLLLGWNAHTTNFIKGAIRNLLMTKSASSSLVFTRMFTFTEETLEITHELKNLLGITKVRIGGQFATRYVPQSRYFQREELQNPYIETKPSDACEVHIVQIMRFADNSVATR